MEITMKNKFLICLLGFFIAITGCSKTDQSNDVTLTSKLLQLEKGLSAIKYEGDYGFDEFLLQGGAASDAEVAAFLSKNIGKNISFDRISFGCSTISTKDTDGNLLFGRNFDWNSCNAMIIYSVPETGYASISTVNMDFISMTGISFSALSDTAQAIIGLYAPLDGMNEKGLAVSVNMIQDSATIS